MQVLGLISSCQRTFINTYTEPPLRSEGTGKTEKVRSIFRFHQDYRIYQKRYTP